MAREREPLHLDTNSSLPLREEVYQTLRNAILRGHLLPGERLMEIHLASELGVSRTPVREAIQMLTREGLAGMFPRRGAYVARMSLSELRDVLEIRGALEDLAVSAACEKMTAGQFDELEAAMRAFAAAVRSKDVRRIVEADEQFHQKIYAASGNARLASLIANLREQMYRFRYEYIKGVTDYSLLVREHSAILDALRRKDREQVRNLMQTHLSNQEEAVRRIIGE